jgi:hypothetical protein
MFKPILDTILKFTVSKKLSVFIIGTIMAFTGVGISDNWLILAGIYLGIQGIFDILKQKIEAQKEINNNYDYDS